ncbi:metallophosphoesterase family protein [Thiocystis violacea]|uniref:metallophosphoesterase family protein n=1 Tax=Thiocystis violacea TaxID=13725 RepID=UPI001903961E|nr:metallophosphoesterase family protein [Thiocystis violacea]MBK1716790.1 metallophosphoesterase [Thiocystis violacea]
MKVAIFSDVQGNLPAMEEAVSRILDWDPDLVVMDGDLVNRGPSSLACLELFDQLRRERGWLPVKGNHEAWVLRCGREAPKDALEAEMRRFADWTYQQIQPRVEALEGWPDHLSFDGGTETSWVHVTHGTMTSNRQGITTSVTDEEIRGTLPPDLALFVTAHTHRPLQRVLDGIPILNVGSVGSPFDGDPRGSYALLEMRQDGWHWEILRFAYDRVQAERDFRDLGFIEEGGPLARIMFEEWRRARLLMPLWRRDFEPAVLAGERPLRPAVDAFLAGLD